MYRVKIYTHLSLFPSIQLCEDARYDVLYINIEERRHKTIFLYNENYFDLGIIWFAKLLSS